MKIPSTRTLHDMELAAELRAAGATWETIGEKLKRHPNLVIRWTSLYREDWQRLSREAEARIAQQGTNESRAAMRLMLRHKNSKVRIRAVDQLTKLLRAEQARAKPADAHTDPSTFLSHLEEMSDDELDETLAEFAEHYQGRRRQDQNDGDDVAGAAGPRGPG